MTPREQGSDHVVEHTFGATHRCIPNPKHNADVESFRGLIKVELFDLETFRSRADFFEKLTTYQAYVHLARPHSHSHWKTPWHRFAQADPKLPNGHRLTPPDRP